MATLDQLVQRGELIPVKGKLLPHEQPMRRMFATPQVQKWFSDVLPTLRTDGYFEGAPTPKDQALEQINGYVRGDPVANWMVPRLLTPKKHGVWELRTADLRFFGWFHTSCNFVIAQMGTAEMCHAHPGLHNGYINECVRIRGNLDLDLPKFTSGNLNDVF